jgi:pyrimidine deaminase RibD-like protein
VSNRIEVIHGMPAADYHAAPGLSHSAMKDLIVSPFRFWHLHLNPERPERKETEFMIFGRALHSAVLDSDEVFESQFACEYIPPEGALDTVPQMREWYLSATGNKAKGTTKAEVAAQCRAVPDCPPLVMDGEAAHLAQNQGKALLKADDWYRLAGCARALRREPEFQRLTEKGHAEVSYFVTDPETGVALKARMDFVNPATTLDIKTFSQMRGKTIDRSVADAFYYEGYHRQAFTYTYIRKLAGEGIPEFVNSFAESEEPHEVRLKLANRSALYWIEARNEVTRLIRLYAQLTKEFGDRPWRTDAALDEMQDEEIKALAWA